MKKLYSVLFLSLFLFASCGKNPYITPELTGTWGAFITEITKIELVLDSDGGYSYKLIIYETEGPGISDTVSEWHGHFGTFEITNDSIFLNAKKKAQWYKDFPFINSNYKDAKGRSPYAYKFQQSNLELTNSIRTLLMQKDE